MKSLLILAAVAWSAAALADVPAGVPGEANLLEKRSLQTRVKLLGWTLPYHHPPLVPGKTAKFMRPDDDVIGVLVDGHARAYPAWVYSRYHSGIDFFQGKPVLLLFCEACSAAGIFDPVVDGRLLTFDYAGDRLGTYELVDAQTHSHWIPAEGYAYSGPLKGTRLKRFRLYHAKWSEWLGARPDTNVAVGTPEVRRRKHSARWFFGSPHLSERFTNLLATFDKRLRLNELVFGLPPAGGDGPAAYPLEELRKAGGLVSLTHGREPVALVLGGDHRVGAFSRKFGGKVLELKRLPGKDVKLKDQDGSVWDEWGVAISGPSVGKELELTDGYLSAWFHWVNQHQETRLLGSEGSEAKGVACGKPPEGAAKSKLELKWSGGTTDSVEGDAVELKSEAGLYREYRIGKGAEAPRVGLTIRKGAFERACPVEVEFPFFDPKSSIVIHVTRPGWPAAQFASDHPRSSGKLRITSYSAGPGGTGIAFSCEVCALAASGAAAFSGTWDELWRKLWVMDNDENGETVPPTVTISGTFYAARRDDGRSPPDR